MAALGYAWVGVTNIISAAVAMLTQPTGLRSTVAERREPCGVLDRIPFRRVEETPSA
jgi:hypothetical protein